jgi:hypothetical protein
MANWKIKKSYSKIKVRDQKIDKTKKRYWKCFNNKNKWTQKNWVITKHPNKQFSWNGRKNEQIKQIKRIIIVNQN